MIDEETKETSGQSPESRDQSTEEVPAEIIDVPEEKVAGKVATETPEEEIDESQIEVMPYTQLRPGMVVRVHEKIIDQTAKGERERVQVFQGIIMGIQGAGISRTMRIRKDSKGWMVEKIFPLSSPKIEKIEVVKQFRVRRAKLGYLKGDFKRKLKEIKEVKETK
ncbi:50S ribosomal protein L19 [Candidatus Uhrbacteria bacterium CG_4_9_14_0_2_um_filter_41_50]|uniref:50S ribosomal protein L19 n=1 Tax=Candidatus Uhrbacteria bacterium CG_4_9_14_0_2_um_filter_41_50 TaxID=1975031 RepID=A0A2M8EPZ1_9BACT|nr:MAG: 50S ribosomal protein L19 [Candidatus Uhrbacteria bacterium CG_4_10_14_0_2_um_filter_41_21]PJB85067.1 MAG: 50S ribosomal protein L19 [Candidatus Uhrbacteria bacterium CG_4_9_14_0_8_um_filter_41_16]PJC24747.1 MAG: 50S ribosomal protein L19 [Candidatus Uhrbacteria bacterium CG_4_9_14_0_2_um_filter_41_50]